MRARLDDDEYDDNRLTAEIIRSWFRELSLRFHPDRGGSHDAMKALNEAHSRLKEMIG